MNSEFEYRGFERYLKDIIWQYKSASFFFEFKNDYFVKVETSFPNEGCWSVSIYPQGSYLTVYPDGGWEVDIARYDESLDDFEWYYEVTGNKVKDILQLVKDLK